MGRPKKTTNPTAVQPKPTQPEGATTVSKTEAVRQAIAEGLNSPGDIAAFAKSKYGLEIPKPQVSAYKAQAKKKAAGGGSNGKPGRNPKASVEGYLAPPPKIVPTGEGDLLDALEAMKPLVASLGKEKVHRLVDLLG
jgi:hypothetical protein